MSLPSNRQSTVSEHSSSSTAHDDQYTTANKAQEAGHIDAEAQIGGVSLSGTEKASDPSPPATEREWLTGVRLWLVFGAVTLALFLMLLDLAILSTAIPYITNDFNSLADIGWYGSAYQLTAACMQPLTGKLYTLYTTKWTFLAFFGIFELGSVICGAATSSNMLIVGRAVAGIGSSGIQNGGLTILAGAMPVQQFASMIGLLFACAQSGVALGPVIGGAFTEYTTWRWCFYINLPVGAVLAAMILFIHLPDQMAKPPFREGLAKSIRDLDLLGFVIFSGFTIQLLLALQWGGSEHAWNSSVIIGLFCGAFAVLVIFAVYNYRKGDKALVPISILSMRVVWSSVLAIAGLMGVIVCNSYFYPIYFQAVLNKTPLLSGVAYLPSVVSQLVAVLVSGFIINKFGYYLPVAIFGLTLNCIGNGLGSLLSPTSSQAQWIGYQIPLGVGRGPAMQVIFLALQHALPGHQISLGQSMLAFGQSIGGAVSVAIGNVIFQSELRSGLRDFAPSVDPAAVTEAGATAFRLAIPAADLPGVILAFSTAVNRVFYWTAGLSVATFFVAWGIGWGNINKKA